MSETLAELQKKQKLILSPLVSGTSHIWAQKQNFFFLIMTSRQRGHAHLCMNRRNCQVQDAVNAVIGDDILGTGDLRDAMLHSLLPAFLKIKAATGSNADFRE